MIKRTRKKYLQKEIICGKIFLGDVMFIIYGVKVFNKIKGYFGEVHECENCHRKYKSRLLKHSKWIHIWYIPFIPFGSSYSKICPICYKEDQLTKKEAKVLMTMPDSIGQNVVTYYVHHRNTNTYDIWTKDMNGTEEFCVLSNLNKFQIKNFKKNMGLKEVTIKEVD